MNTQILKQSLGWGFILWFIGYVLGIIFYMSMPTNMVGWAIMPIGIALTLWVLFKKVTGTNLLYYVKIAVAWTIMAVLCDYVFLVRVFKPADGYYKLDVYVYYIVTFILPLIAGVRKIKISPSAK